MCGGTHAGRGHIPEVSGLSPRVRGNRGGESHAAAAARSIPACAGEPRWEDGAGKRDPVYPRVCGGTDLLSCKSCGSRGLSPRVRGNLAIEGRGRQERRSIPACAGEPCLPTRRIRRRPVYPRVCGGTYRWPLHFGPPEGLSPRVRGNRAVSKPARAVERSIPACAGEPTSRRLRGCRRGVYPRVCGGTGSGFRKGLRLCGLSPRVRGNLLMRSMGFMMLRSIPACAGEP